MAVKPSDPNHFGVPSNDQYGFIHSDADERWAFGGNRELAYGTLVRMADGSVRPIEALVVGDEVLSWDGARAIPSTVVSIPYDDFSDTVKVITLTGIEVIGSGDHCFPINQEDHSRRKIRKMTLNEAGQDKGLGNRFVSAGPHYFSPRAALPFSGLLLGLFLGDGSFGNSPSAGYPRPNFTNTDELVRDLFTSEINKAYPELRCVAKPSDQSRLYISLVGGAKRENRFINDLRGLDLVHKSDKKYVPDCFKYASPETRRDIIRGLIITDGCVDRYKTTIYSNSLRLLNDIEEILISLGGRSKTYKDGNPANEHQNQQYKLQFSVGFLGELNIGDLGRKNPKHTLTHGVHRQDLAIGGISDNGVKRCRCITVDHPSHTFVLANGIVTYNSGKTEAGVNDCNMFCLGTHPVRSAYRKPPVKVRYCAPKWRESVEGVLLEKFREIVPRCELRGGSWRTAWSNTYHKLYYRNGSYIQFKSYEEDLNTFGGANLDAVYQDEKSPYPIYLENSARLTDRNGYFVATMTPELGMAWEEDHITNPPPGVSIERWYFSLYGNPHIAKAGIEKLVAKIKDKRMIETKVYGRSVALHGLVIPQFDREITVIPDRHLHPDAYKVFCIDFHPKVPAHALWAAWEPTDGQPNLVIYRAKMMKADIPEWQQTIHALSAGEKIQKWLGDEPDGSETEDYKGDMSPLHQFREGLDRLPIIQVSKSAGSFNASIYKLWDMFKGDPLTKKPRIFIFNSVDHAVEQVDGKYLGSLPWELERWQFMKEQKADDENLRERIALVNDHYISDLRYIVMNEPVGVGSLGPSVTSDLDGKIG